MIQSRFVGSSFLSWCLLPVILAAVAGGCDSSPQFSQSGVLSGNWIYSRFDTAAGVAFRRASLLQLSDTVGMKYDTTFEQLGVGWGIDSTTMTRLEFQGVGDGYQRAREIRQTETTIDTTVRYWYFFKRGDSLFYYVGMRYLGGSSGLVGTWKNEDRDSADVGGMTTLDFAGDNMVAIRVKSGTQVQNETRAYRTKGDTLTFDGLPTPYGDRYEVVPGFALYITTRATGGYVGK
jgi:hypothetical protein